MAAVAASTAVPEFEEYLGRDSRPQPYSALAAIRRAAPFHAAGGSVLVVADYADCAAVLRDPRAGSERTTAAVPAGARGPRTRNFLHLDPPDHTRFRRLVSRAFTPRVVAALEPRIREITDELLAGAAARGQLEVVSELAYPLPVQVICELLGVPYEDRELIQSWSAALSEALEPPLLGLVAPEVTTGAARARADFVQYFRELVAQRRREPRDDMVSGLIQAADDGDQLTESELLATCILMINAGHETTVNLLANGVLALLSHPSAWDAVRAEPALAAGAVEEVLRWDAPVQLTTRVARERLTVGAAQAEPGELILLLLAAANRDPAKFDQPDVFDIRRRDAAQHLSFSAGPHFCLGAGLARLEARIAFEQFARWLPGSRLAELAVAYKPNLCLRGPHRLDLIIDPVPATGGLVP